MLQRVEGDTAETVRGVVPQFPRCIGVCRLMEGDCDEGWVDPRRCRIEGARKVQTEILIAALALMVGEARPSRKTCQDALRDGEALTILK